MRFYKNRGYQYALDLVDESNKPSMSAMKKWAFQGLEKCISKIGMERNIIRLWKDERTISASFKRTYSSI